jgi:hypothetical protein
MYTVYILYIYIYTEYRLYIYYICLIFPFNTKHYILQHNHPVGAAGIITSMKLVSKLLGGLPRWELRHGASSCEACCAARRMGWICHKETMKFLFARPEWVWKWKIPQNCNFNGQIQEHDFHDEVSTFGVFYCQTHFGISDVLIFTTWNPPCDLGKSSISGHHYRVGNAHEFLNPRCS